MMMISYFYHDVAFLHMLYADVFKVSFFQSELKLESGTDIEYYTVESTAHRPGLKRPYGA